MLKGPALFLCFLRPSTSLKPVKRFPCELGIYLIWKNDSFVIISRKGDLVDSFCEYFMLPTSDYVHSSPLFFAREKAIFIVIENALKPQSSRIYIYIHKIIVNFVFVVFSRQILL